jgi:Tat protein translocase TatB subunit
LVGIPRHRGGRLVVIGPRDLPRVLRTVGQWVRKARQIAAEFQNSIEDMAREAEMAELRKEIAETNARLVKPVDAYVADGAATVIAPSEIYGPPYVPEALGHPPIDEQKAH